MDQTFLLIMLLVGGIGTFLFYVGWNRKRYDGGRYCRHCFYRIDTSGTDVERCSECGTTLTSAGAIVDWQHDRQRSFVALGVLLLLLSVGGVAIDVMGSISRIDIYRVLPTWYLLRSDVSAEDDFGTERVRILRERVLDGELSEAEEIRFTRLLCERATNLHLDSRNRTMTYTGMTLNLLLLHKPEDARVNALLEAIVEQTFRQNETFVEMEAGDSTAELILPTFDFDPVWPFLRNGEDSSVRMRSRVMINEVEQNGRSLLVRGADGNPPEAAPRVLDWPILGEIQQRSGESVARSFAVPIHVDDLDFAQELVIDVTIEWFIEDETIPIDGADLDSGIPPWHRSSHRAQTVAAPLNQASLLLRPDDSRLPIVIMPNEESDQ